MAEVKKIRTMELPPKYNKGPIPYRRNEDGSTSAGMKSFDSSLKVEVDIQPSDGDPALVPNNIENDQKMKNPISDDDEEALTLAGSLIKPGDRNNNPYNMDPKRIKRILANRLSAQKSRFKKLQYISELERCANSLQAEVNVLSPQVAYYDKQRILLKMENSALKQRISHLMGNSVYKDAQFQVLKEEKERLNQLISLEMTGFQTEQQKKFKMNGMNLDHLNCFM